ncbi:MAG TPA: acyl-CoA dehydrogenase [Planctomycetota bacterium]|nr:acyl-CoA dehydrogenase [Planctomycetota bacterium]
MNLTLSAEEALIQATARDFADKELAPLASSIDQKGAIPRDILEKMAALGFLGMLTPEAYGGVGLTNLALALVQLEINRACASTGVTMSVHNSLCQSPILRFGSEEQKHKYLPRLARGEWIGAYSLTEPVSGTDAAALITTATKDGSDYVINGTKNFVTNGGFADVFVLFARTDPSPAAKQTGISAFIVEKTLEGLTVGKAEKKMGIRGSSTTSLFFDGCRVPAANLLGTEGDGLKIALSTLDGGRVGIASQATGIAMACLDASIKYAKERKQFDRPIGDFQAIQWKIAEMATDIDAARLLIFRAARMRDAGEPHTREASMAKLFASTMANKHANQAVQIHGGVGYIKDFPVERYFRDAKITEIYEGTSEVQRIVVARSLLK